MTEKLKISLAEFDIDWENPKVNRDFLDELTENHNSDLIVLPEMFTTGFSMNPGLIAEEAYGKTYKWMKSKSEKEGIAICGSVSTREAGKFYNRFYFVTPEKDWHYDKKHLFGYGKETGEYTPGNQIVTAEFKGWKFRLIVCYDLRFPVWSRNTDDYDVLLCPANWPAVRNEQWKALLKARAIENMAYCVGVNRLGVDDYDLEYTGVSKVFDAVGAELKLRKINQFLLQTELSYESAQKFRKNYGFLNDKDKFELI